MNTLQSGLSQAEYTLAYSTASVAAWCRDRMSHQSSWPCVRNYVDIHWKLL